MFVFPEENISFGSEKETIDQTKLIEAIRLSQLDKFVDQQKDGLKTLIGENGAKISGGQIQRIGIARALYSNPDLLIIDEGTNSLDKKTEREILDEIKSLKEDLSIILVSHDMDLILSYSDHIFELEDKKLKKN